MKSAPRLCRPFPWVEWSLGWSCTVLLTVWTLSATSSISASILGHQMYDQARAFILLAPRWASCNSSNTDLWPWFGTTTIAPHKRHLFRNVRSLLRDLNGLKSSPSCCVVGQPCKMYWRTLERVGSVLVHRLMCSELIIMVDKCFSTRSPGMQSESVVTFLGKQLRSSAFPRFFPGLCLNSVKIST